MTTSPAGRRHGLRVVVMGVSGSGKTTVGGGIAAALGLPFADADDFHSPANIAKMRAGQPLSDEDRLPWLEAIGTWLEERKAAVVTCSALKHSHRDRLRRHCPDAVFVFLSGPPELIARRQAARQGHFMPASLAGSQFATLEPPEAEEGAITLDVSGPPEAVLERGLTALRKVVPGI
ncbi:gluconokinase [Roseomonas sp. BN140053]|uniref:gluconokinase n=1 Tax=Roseomonas sp. BN140053 TaxID=3391898 RepID=UPI0039E9B443